MWFQNTFKIIACLLIIITPWDYLNILTADCLITCVLHTRLYNEDPLMVDLWSKKVTTFCLRHQPVQSEIHTQKHSSKWAKGNFSVHCWWLVDEYCSSRHTRIVVKISDTAKSPCALNQQKLKVIKMVLGTLYITSLSFSEWSRHGGRRCHIHATIIQKSYTNQP